MVLRGGRLGQWLHAGVKGIQEPILTGMTERVAEPGTEVGRRSGI